MEQTHKRKSHKTLLWTAGLLLVILLAAAIYVYRQVFAPLNPVDTVYIYIDEEKDYEDVILQLKENDALPSEKIFRLLAEKMNYPERVKSGRYGISAGMTMPDVIRILRSGTSLRSTSPSTTSAQEKI